MRERREWEYRFINKQTKSLREVEREIKLKIHKEEHHERERER